MRGGAELWGTDTRTLQYLERSCQGSNVPNRPRFSIAANFQVECTVICIVFTVVW